MIPETKLIDQEQRDRAAQDISGSYIIEAAAGTGKTTVLVTRIINVIKAGEARLDEIVAITFTEKAAAELKVKLRQELEKALQGEVSPGERQRIGEALSDLERMQVTTIHSFCGSLLRERPVEAGLDPNFEVADDLTSSLIRAEVWEAWVERQMDANDPALRRAVLIGITPEQVRKVSQCVLENHDVLQYLPSPPSPEEVKKAIGQFIKSFQKALNAMTGLKKYCRDPDEDRAALKIDRLNGQFLKLQSLPQEEKENFIVKEITTGSSRVGAQKNWEGKAHLENVRVEMDQLSTAHGEVRSSIVASVIAALAERLTDYVKAYERAKESAMSSTSAIFSFLPGICSRDIPRSGNTSVTVTNVCWLTSSRTQTHFRWRSSFFFPLRTSFSWVTPSRASTDSVVLTLKCTKRPRSGWGRTVFSTSPRTSGARALLSAW